MSDLEAALCALTGEFPEASRLALDAWQMGERDMAAGLSFARSLILWCREWRAEQARLAAKWGAGGGGTKANPPAPVPDGKTVWVLTDRGRVVRAGEAKSVDGTVTHWCREKGERWTRSK